MDTHDPQTLLRPWQGAVVLKRRQEAAKMRNAGSRPLKSEEKEARKGKEGLRSSQGALIPEGRA